MVFRLHAHHPLVKVFNSTLVSLPSPSTLSILWNFGSLLGLSLVVQILTGVFLAMHYIPDMELAFSSVIYTSQDVHYGWLLRALHSNGASFFFICLFIHIGRGIYYGSYVFFHTWMVGVVICFLVMGTAFMGYVLPWGQMSFWGATVITNLLSVVPYIGLDLVQWVWGGFSVSNATLTRFFTFHFLMPFAVAAMSGVHLVFLHMSGSSNQLGLPLNADKIMFYPYYGWKDLTGVLIYIYLLLGVSLLAPYMLGDTDNFILANPMVTPTHIQPEWYFLFAYAILRSIPNKLGGVVALVVSIAILFILPFTNLSTFKGKTFFPFSSFLFWSLVASVIILSWIGMCPVEPPYIFVGQLFTVIYFSLYLMIPLSEKVWCDLLLK